MKITNTCPRCGSISVLVIPMVKTALVRESGEVVHGDMETLNVCFMCLDPDEAYIQL